jgi:hypothetical protein
VVEKAAPAKPKSAGGSTYFQERGARANRPRFVEVPVPNWLRTSPAWKVAVDVSQVSTGSGGTGMGLVASISRSCASDAVMHSVS